MTGGITVRDAELGDAARIAAIHVASWRATYRGAMPDTYLDSLSTEQRLQAWRRILGSAIATVKVWVAEIEHEIVGFCSVGPGESSVDDATDPLVLHTIYLQPGHERRGIGGALIRHAEDGMRQMGARSAILWVLEENQPARRFYEASGWMRDGSVKEDEVWGQSVREVRYRKQLDTNTS